MKQKLGYDKMGIVEKSKNNPQKWFFSVIYADLINDKKVWRTHPNYVSEVFKTKKEAQNQLNIKLTN